MGIDEGRGAKINPELNIKHTDGVLMVLSFPLLEARLLAQCSEKISTFTSTLKGPDRQKVLILHIVTAKLKR